MQFGVKRIGLFVYRQYNYGGADFPRNMWWLLGVHGIMCALREKSGPRRSFFARFVAILDIALRSWSKSSHSDKGCFVGFVGILISEMEVSVNNFPIVEIKGGSKKLPILHFRPKEKYPPKMGTFLCNETVSTSIVICD